MARNQPYAMPPDAPFACRGGADGTKGIVTPAALGATIFPCPTRALWIGVAGNLEVIMGDGTNMYFTNVPVGWFRICCTQVISSGGAFAGTTATGICAVN